MTNDSPKPKVQSKPPLSLKNFAVVIAAAAGISVITFLIGWSVATGNNDNGLQRAIVNFGLFLLMASLATIYLIGIAIWAFSHTSIRVEKNKQRPYLILSTVPIVTLVVVWAAYGLNYGTERLDGDRVRFTESTLCLDLRKADDVTTFAQKQAINDACDDAKLTESEKQTLETLYADIQVR